MTNHTNSPSSSPPLPRRSPWLPPHGALLLLLLSPVAVAVSVVLLLLPPEGFSPAPLPPDYSFDAVVAVPELNDGILPASELLGDGLLPGPEDLAYDAGGGFLYTGCSDGWIRRVNLRAEEDIKVEDWAFVGGRPLGLAFSPTGDLIVAESDKGVMQVKPERTTALLTDEAEGTKFRLTDGVDVGADGTIYFTDASCKFSLDDHILDILEGRPHGRLLSFDPSTNQTRVLAGGLYFANGVAVAPDQRSLVYCETVLRRCRRYHIRGEKRGTTENFAGDLPGFPDNIRYDGEGHYWIGIAVGKTVEWDLLMKYPRLRKLLAIVDRLVRVPTQARNSGVLRVDLGGQPVSMFIDRRLALVTGGVKIGRHLYYGSLHRRHIGRVDLTRHSAES